MSFKALTKFVRSFLVGSQADNTATSKSDVDLIIMTDETTKLKLVELSDNKAVPIRFGKLHIVACTSDIEYAAWVVEAEKTKEVKEVKKEESEIIGTGNAIPYSYRGSNDEKIVEELKGIRESLNSYRSCGY